SLQTSINYTLSRSIIFVDNRYIPRGALHSFPTRRSSDLPGEVADHGLEVEQGFEPALADLRLIRRVRRVPGRVLQDVALDHRRQDRKSTRLNSSHVKISYAVFCLKKKKTHSMSTMML